jgi:hypothetical protein
MTNAHTRRRLLELKILITSLSPALIADKTARQRMPEAKRKFLRTERVIDQLRAAHPQLSAS